MNEEELTEKFRVYETQIMQINEQLGAVESATLDLQKISLGLEEIKEGEEILSPMGKGIFVKSKVLSEELTVDIGGGNFVKKTIPETRELISEQVKKLNSMKMELENELQRIDEEITNTMKEHEESHEHEHSHEGHEHN